MRSRNGKLMYQHAVQLITRTQTSGAEIRTPHRHLHGTGRMAFDPAHSATTCELSVDITARLPNFSSPRVQSAGQGRRSQTARAAFATRKDTAVRVLPGAVLASWCQLLLPLLIWNWMQAVSYRGFSGRHARPLCHVRNAAAPAACKAHMLAGVAS